MSELMFAGIMILVAIGFFCVGALWCLRREIFWRIQCIKLEHDLAREQEREPRTIQKLEIVGKNDEMS
jgi:hypothetical protein